MLCLSLGALYQQSPKRKLKDVKGGEPLLPPPEIAAAESKP